MIKSFQISFFGIVQGVGFRPMIYNYAIKHQLKGCVYNAADGLHITFNTQNVQKAESIYIDLKATAPKFARITSSHLKETEFTAFSSFQITSDSSSATHSALLTPDYAVCSECKAEVFEQNNRRFRYPFTTCTVCGPRYSIATALPYDRANTTMSNFEMCMDCKKEYEDITNRRYYAQTISCNECGVQMMAFDQNKKCILQGNKKIIPFITEQLKNGKTLAVKGIGGFLLLCDAFNTTTINKLRQTKHRPHKPFAIMCGNINQARKFAYINFKEEELLTTEIAPIVICTAKKSKLALPEIAPGLNSLGIMLAYTPLFDIILSDFGNPLVATSGNISGSPIIFNNEEAVNNLSTFADYVITNNREILMPQDDSVITLSPKYQQKIILRRSRGLAPNYFPNRPITDKKLATSAMLKSSFALLANNNVYVSQYLGNTDNYEAQEMYKACLNHLQQVTHTLPSSIVTDLHPQYFSHQLANSLSNSAYTVPHHQAHFSAVLAENNLIDEPDVLGVIFDGTGLGEDQQIHGGEYYKYDGLTMKRCNHFGYFPYILGDKMAREPRISAYAICNNIDEAKELLKNKFNPTEWDYYSKLTQQNGILQCSSVGRMFDAVASLLNLLDVQTYEGQAAMLLEQLAQDYYNSCDYLFNDSYFSINDNYRQIPTVTLFSGIIADIFKKKSNQYIAAKFHYSLVHITGIIAQNNHCSKVAFSGGVFQNALLVDLMKLHLGQLFSLYFHLQLSPNDECISLGQLFYKNEPILNP